MKVGAGLGVRGRQIVVDDEDIMNAQHIELISGECRVAKETKKFTW